MSDETLTAANMNWRLVEDAKEAMSRGDWMLALSLFEQSRRICINEGWREGVHYADDMIVNIYPMVKRQIDDSNKVPDEAPDKSPNDYIDRDLPHREAYFHARPVILKEGDEDMKQDDPNPYTSSENKQRSSDAFEEGNYSRRIHRMDREHGRDLD